MNFMTDAEFRNAVEVVNRGDFGEIKDALKSLGFVVRDTDDPDHCIYYHPLLKGDPIFRRPTNLYRGHGPRRDRNRITTLDQKHARQRIRVLKAVGTSTKEEEDE